jgi:hypothetical protein
MLVSPSPAWTTGWAGARPDIPLADIGAGPDGSVPGSGIQLVRDLPAIDFATSRGAFDEELDHRAQSTIPERDNSYRRGLNAEIDRQRLDGQSAISPGMTSRIVWSSGKPNGGLIAPPDVYLASHVSQIKRLAESNRLGGAKFAG